jgi:hypothetical protein
MSTIKVTEAQQANAVLVSKMHDAKKKITLLENGLIEASNKEKISAKDYAEFMDNAFPAAQTPMAWCDVKKSHKSEFGQFVWASRTRIVEALDAAKHSNSAGVWKRAREASIYYEAPEKKEKSEKTDLEKLRILINQAGENCIAIENAKIMAALVTIAKELSNLK